VILYMRKEGSRSLSNALAVSDDLTPALDPQESPKNGDADRVGRRNFDLATSRVAGSFAHPERTGVPAHRKSTAMNRTNLLPKMIGSPPSTIRSRV